MEWSGSQCNNHRKVRCGCRQQGETAVSCLVVLRGSFPRSGADSHESTSEMH